MKALDGLFLRILYMSLCRNMHAIIVSLADQILGIVESILKTSDIV